MTLYVNIPRGIRNRRKFLAFSLLTIKHNAFIIEKKLTAQHCARNLAVSRPQKVWGLTFAGTWGEGRHPQVSFSALHLTFLKLETWFFCIAAFLSFLNVHWKFQVSVAFGFGDMTLFFRSCHVLNDEYPISCDGYGPCELLTRWFRLFFCQSYLPPIIEHVVLRCTDVRVRVKVNLGHLKLLRFRQAEFTFREVSLTVCLVKASQFMIKCNRDTQTDLCTHQYIHRHTQTYKHISLTLT